MTIGGGSIIAGDFTAGNGVRIGEAVTFGEGCVVSAGATVESGSIVPPGTLIPSWEQWGGNPLSKTRSSDEEANVVFAQQIEVIRDDHIHEFLPFGNAHEHLEEVNGR